MKCYTFKRSLWVFSAVLMLLTACSSKTTNTSSNALSSSAESVIVSESDDTISMDNQSTVSAASNAAEVTSSKRAVTSSKKASTPSKAEVISSNKAVTSSNTLDINRKQSIRPGLYLENGVIKFYGIGTNYYDLATRQFYDPLAPTFEKGVKTVKSYGIPMIRVRLSAWGSEGMSLFWNDRETYWVVMDQAVRLCEQYEIGIIGTLAWTTNPYMTQGETNGHFLKNKNSEGYKKMLTYMEAVVTRYRNSPAIWGWEVGNEFNLAVDLDKVQGTNYELTAALLADFYKDITPRIAKWDGYGRIITTGNSQNRHAAWNLYHNNNWGNDTAEQTAEMMKMYDTPEMGMSSIHVYNVTQIFGGKTITLSEYLSEMVKICKSMGKPLYIGEYCDDTVNGITGAAWTSEVEAQALNRFKQLHNAIIENDVQLSFIWAQNNDKDVYRNPSTYVQGMLKYAKQANADMVKSGKQKVGTYWSKTHNIFYQG